LSGKQAISGSLLIEPVPTSNTFQGYIEVPASERTVDLDGLYRAYGDTVSRWVQRLWGRGDSEDVLHDVFVVVQRRLPEFRGEAAITTWLYAITVRVVNDRRRKERWRRWLFTRAAPELRLQQAPVETPLAGAMREQAADIVYAVLDSLSERDRTLIILFELETLPVAQIAAVLSMTEGNVWVALHRARARFRKAYRARFGAGRSDDDG
jgi:RNA polymerase sigma-70 factor (ECF subfamily)